jgi:hypothetical protein
LTDAALQAGLERYEIQKTIQSGLNGGKSRPRPSLAQQDAQLPPVDIQGLHEAAAKLATNAPVHTVALASQRLPAVYAPVSDVESVSDADDETGLDGAVQPTDGERTDARRKALLDGWPVEKIARWLTKRGEEGAEAIADRAVKWATKYRPGNQIKTRDGPRWITCVEQINSEYVMLTLRGQEACVAYIRDALPITMKDFQLRLGSAVVIDGIDAKGKPITKQAANYWTNHTRRKFATEVVFTSGAVQPHQFNLWTGGGVRPKEGNCQLILKHIGEVIASGNVDDYNQFLNLLAWQVQNVGRPSRIVVALFSEAQQTGKGILLEQVLLPIWGLNGHKITSSEHAFGRFNDPLRGKAYLFIDEANFAGDRRLADRIKAEAAATTVTVEAKCLSKMQFPAGLNIFMATNHRNVGRVELHDARHWLLEVSACRAGDNAYFTELANEIDNGGREAFLDFLLKCDVSNFVPQRDIVRENALQIENKTNSIIGSPIAWLLECIEAEALFGGDVAINWNNPLGQKVKGMDLLNAYRNWFDKVPGHNRQSPASMDEFWRIIKKLGFIERRNMHGRWREVPEIPTLKRAIENELRGLKTEAPGHP